MNLIMTFKLSAEEEKKLEKICSKLGEVNKQELLKSIAIPCTDKDVLRLLENTQKYFEEKTINEAKNQLTLQKILDEAPSLLEEIIEIATEIAIVILNFKETLIDEGLKADIVRTIRDMISNELGARERYRLFNSLLYT